MKSNEITRGLYFHLAFLSGGIITAMKMPILGLFLWRESIILEKWFRFLNIIFRRWWLAGLVLKK